MQGDVGQSPHSYPQYLKANQLWHTYLTIYWISSLHWQKCPQQASFEDQSCQVEKRASSSFACGWADLFKYENSHIWNSPHKPNWLDFEVLEHMRAAAQEDMGGLSNTYFSHEIWIIGSPTWRLSNLHTQKKYIGTAFLSLSNFGKQKTGYCRFECCQWF